MKLLIISGLSAVLNIAVASQPPAIGTQGMSDTSAPLSGQSMETVRANFGEPSLRLEAIGEPPITRWQYQGFTVYFEYDRVIHSVKHRS